MSAGRSAASGSDRGQSPRRRLLPPFVIVAIALAIVLVVVYAFRAVFLPLLLALALAYILEPLVQWLMRRRLSRLLAVSLIMGAFVLVLLGAFGWLAVETAQFVEAITGHAKDQDGLLVRGVKHFFEVVRDELAAPGWSQEWSEKLARYDWAAHTGEVRALLKGMFQQVWGSVELLLVATLMPIYLFYLMLDLQRIWGFITEYLPARDRERTVRVLATLHGGMAAFLRGRVIIAVLKGALTSGGLLLCGTPMAIVVGMTAGLLSIVPLIGPALGFVIALALTVAEEISVSSMLWVAVVFVVVEVLENFVLTPAVMKEGADLHPLTIIFCVVFWGAALGGFGALVAIPLTLVVKVLWLEYVLPALRELAGRDDGAAAAEG